MQSSSCWIRGAREHEARVQLAELDTPITAASELQVGHKVPTRDRSVLVLRLLRSAHTVMCNQQHGIGSSFPGPVDGGQTEQFVHVTIEQVELNKTVRL